jgi:hypothetical protein
MDYIISESQSHTVFASDWVTSTSYQLKVTYTFEI